MRQAALAMIGVVAFTAFSCSPEIATPPPARANAAGEDVTEVRIDPPWRVDGGGQFEMPVTYHVPSDQATAAPAVANVTFDHNGVISYAPDQLTLKQNESRKVTVTVTRTHSGLAQVAAFTDCCEDPPKISIDTGFRGRLVWEREEPLESNMSHWATLTFVDNADTPLGLDAPLIVRVDLANALIRRAGDTAWQRGVTFEVPKGATDTGPLEVYPTDIYGSRGTMQVRGFLNDDSDVLFDVPVHFAILPPMWVRVGMTILGALVFSLYQLTKGPQRRMTIAILGAVVSAVFAGIFAWALADWNVLGIKTDTSRLTGYFVLGLLTSYAGVEPVLARVAQRDRDKKSTPDPGTADPPQAPT